MKTIVRSSLTSAAFAAALVSTFHAGSGRAGRSSDVQAFVGARLIDGTGRPTVADATLVVRGGRVEAVGPSVVGRPPAGARTVDLAGKFVIPGLISTHVHVSDVQGLRAPASIDENTLRQPGVFARYGVTTVWSLGGEREPAFRPRGAGHAGSRPRALLPGRGSHRRQDPG